MTIPDYLSIPAEQLGRGTTVKVRCCGDMDDVARDMAQAMLDVVAAARREGRQPTLIVPVGPVDQFPVLAGWINQRRDDWRNVVLINMDEYLTDDGPEGEKGDSPHLPAQKGTVPFFPRWVDVEHPLSFRGYMNRKFYDLIDPELAPPPANRVFPDPADCGAVARLIEARGGVDACFGGIGINGHIAFNEPPEPGETVSLEAFAARPTRVLDLSRETRTINSVTVGGELSVIPRRAITVGMREILAARRLRFYCNRPWQRGVARRVLHGPITPACPASLLRTHPDAELTVAEFVAEPPDIRLR
jgi:glucosamine-6-phosphate deaminase